MRDNLGQILTIVDPDIVHYPWGTLELFMRLALRCCERLPEKRPTMAEVVRELENIASSSSGSNSSPDAYTLDMLHPSEVDSDHWNDAGSQNSVQSERSDTVELLSKTVTFVRPR